MNKFLRYLRDLHLVPREIGLWRAVQLESIDKLTRVLSMIGIHPRWPVARVQLSSLAHDVWIRLGSSDYYALKQIFMYHNYKPAEHLNSVNWVIDAGANAGFFSLLMLNRYPRARTIAVEPEPGNFKICCANLAPYGERAKAICAALWSHPAQLAISGSGWSAEVHEAQKADPGNVEAVDLPVLTRMTGQMPIDVLKIDIERSELHVFANPQEWLPSVRNIVIELHGSDCEQVFFDALAPFDYTVSVCGDATVCTGLAAKTVSRAQA